MDRIEELRQQEQRLKAEAYDLASMAQAAQQRLMQKNQQIAAIGAEIMKLSAGEKDDKKPEKGDQKKPDGDGRPNKHGAGPPERKA